MTLSEPLVYLQGRFLPRSQAHVAIYDAGVIRGVTVNDMVRTFAHKPFRLEDHVARLYRSCKSARIPITETKKQMLENCARIIEHSLALLGQKEDLAINWWITPGHIPIFLGPDKVDTPMTSTVCIQSFTLPFRLWRHYYVQGAHVVTPSVRHVPPQCIDSKIKHSSRLHWWLAEHEARLVDPKAIAVCLDLYGNLTESGASNFVIVHGKTVISPSPRNILWGISLTTVSELCQELGLTFLCRDIQTHDVINADEAYLTSTPYCLAPVTKINGITIGDGKPCGPVFQQLISAWSRRVGMDILDQLMNG